MLSQKFDIEVFQECFGAHHHEYPQILVPMGETMELSIGNSDYNCHTPGIVPCTA